MIAQLATNWSLVPGMTELLLLFLLGCLTRGVGRGIEAARKRLELSFKRYIDHSSVTAFSVGAFLGGNDE